MTAAAQKASSKAYAIRHRLRTGHDGPLTFSLSGTACILQTAWILTRLLMSHIWLPTLDCEFDKLVD